MRPRSAIQSRSATGGCCPVEVAPHSVSAIAAAPQRFVRLLIANMATSLDRSYPGAKRRHPFGDLYGRWIRQLTTGLRNVGGFQQALRANLSKLVVNRAAEVRGLLPERDAAAAVGEMPLEDR